MVSFTLTSTIFFLKSECSRKWEASAVKKPVTLATIVKAAKAIGKKMSISFEDFQPTKMT